MNITYLVIGIVVGLLIGRMTASRQQMKGVSGINAERGRDKDEAKAKILAMIREKGSVGNNDVQSALGVSDATATNYLQELESEGQIVQVGQGSAITYHLK